MCTRYFIVTLSLCLVQLSMQQRLGHPFLYFTKSDVPRLQQQARTTHFQIFTRLKKAAENMKEHPERYLPPRDWDKFSSKWNEAHGNNFVPLAMYCVLNDTDVKARDTAIQFFDAFVSLPNWRVKAMMDDDVPVAHSLVAMATAYDFLYEFLDDDRRLAIVQNISSVSREFYKRSFWRAWGLEYIHNHFTNNYVALLTSSLVLEPYDKNAVRWKDRAHQMLNRTMFLLSHVTDGSMNEGVAYGSYTSRSLTQYIFLAKRHLGVNLTDSIWLRENFWFFYRTILPGFRETIGIADTKLHWSYGPESQLFLLDSFVMRNGYGNWLANTIRKMHFEKTSFSQRYCTLHTEFLFYDPSISEKEPPNATTPKLHVFDDWGVVTYGGGIVGDEINGKGNTFLSFKAGVLHGRAINNMVRTKPYSWIKGWRSFNPGHEHPDQGSFEFAPNGVPFITEALYGPKYTWLDNVLLFGPTKIPTCSGNYEGQLGGCGKWLNFKTETTWNARAEVVSSSEVGGMVFISGEISKWYNSYLGLSSVYRAVILLNPGVLLVIDHIEKTPESPTRYVGAFFHNRNEPFELINFPGQRIGSILLNGRTHRILWTNSNGETSVVQNGKAEFPSDFGSRKTHFLNITTKLDQLQTRLAYVFVAPGNKVSRPSLEGNKDGLRASLDINGIIYRVSMVTSYNKSQIRGNFLGFEGFAKVRFGSNYEVRFGVDRKATFYDWKQKLVERRNSKSNSVIVLLWLILLLSFLITVLFFGTALKRWRIAYIRVGLMFWAVGFIFIWRLVECDLSESSCIVVNN